ncbi:metallophosphoesterase [Flavobacterium pectinovorum]|uniref:Metallophosphoesterase n=1 Tax=Flavobacterium pectinovorum TaxID=29533 RepID=A0A502F7P0_9FLAO|nr:metallophosphoesterase [Flavobacterium pectinovorum]TPG45340.1 metallophosphoesterase [Flavobacterium pectinovorum]
MKKAKFVPADMVNWYKPRMLFSIAMKAVISGTFGNYADRRETQAALDTDIKNDDHWKDLEEYYGGTETWIDIVSDTGDGFDSTFAVATCVAKQELEVENPETNGKITIPRAKILIFGGDEVYPFPTSEAYERKFKIPYESALGKDDDTIDEENRPHLYAIPGNHDWYDGLGNFIKIFCQQRKIGIWKTKQHRSYFALPLPNNCWIWALDIQLNSDIDAPQLKYFRSISDKMKAGDSVILITAEPAWVYKAIYKDNKSCERLSFFIDKFIYDKDGITNKKFKLPVVLTGDLHHYSRYSSKSTQYITAGGGGAFLHLTHNLPEKIELKENYKLKKLQSFPDSKVSKKLLLGNLLFPFKNIFFTFLIGSVYLFFYWFFYAEEQHVFYKNNDSSFSIYNAISKNCQLLVDNPGALLITVFLGMGFYAFTETKGFTPNIARFNGFVHSVLQIFVFFMVIYSANFPIDIDSLKFLIVIPDKVLELIKIIIICFLGAGVSSLVMGIYLYITNLFFDMHLDEASSSLACRHYKNFLRIKVHSTGLTIYPIGIKNVPKNWKMQHHKNDTYSFSGNKVETHLIEKPIEIKF